MTTRRSTLGYLASSLAAPTLLSVGPAAAQAAPIKQLTLVVPFPPGGGTDVIARLVADGLRGRYAETVVVENRAGVSGRLGVQSVKGAPADGSVMVFTPAFPLAIFPHIYKAMPYDAFRDFVPVATTSKGAMVLAVGPRVPAEVKSVVDFKAWCKTNPDSATFGAPAGSGQHFAGVLFARLSDTPLRMVPYKGGAPSIIDVLGGHIAAVVTPMSESLPHAKEGKLRILATTTRKRSRFTPEVPTMQELGYDVVFEDWSGLLAPANTPKELITRVNQAVAQIVRSPQGEAAMEKFGVEVDLNTPEQFAALYRSTWERYQTVVKYTGFTAED
jgi:tripartite-type tricarboxylate transporter receptor subunit TctC